MLCKENAVEWMVCVYQGGNGGQTKGREVNPA